MVYRNDPAKDRLMEDARALARSSGQAFVDPFVLFGRASSDDLAHYTPEMLSNDAIYTAGLFGAREEGRAHVSIETVQGVNPRGVPVSVLTVIDRNMPFLYDSVMGEVTSSYRTLFMAIHPIVTVATDADPGHTVLDIAGSDTGQQSRVSLIQLHLAPLPQHLAEELVARLQAVLEQVHVVFSDWKPMLARLMGALGELAAYAPDNGRGSRAEAEAFLSWLRSDNFTFLGMRDYVYSGKGTDAVVERDMGTGLGILANPDVLVLRQGKNAVTTTPEILDFLDGPDLLIVTKANVKSVVHRRAYMDYVGVKRFAPDGTVIGELRIVGLFTATAYTHSVRRIPLLRSRVEAIGKHFGFDPESHSGRILQNTLESYPRDDLFQIDEELLASFCEKIMDLGDRPRVRVLPRVDRFDRFVSVIVYVPREEYDSFVRQKISDYLASVFDGHISAYYPAFPEAAVARVHFIIGRTGGKTPVIPAATLEEAITAIASRWTDRFLALASAGTPVPEVSQAYREAFTPEEAIADLPDLLACAAGETVRIEFYHHVSDGNDGLSLKIFHRDTPLALSGRVPLLENLGFSVISERTFEIDVRQDGASTPVRVVLHDMELSLADGGRLDIGRYGPMLEEAFLAAFHGSADNDSFNRLVLAAGLTCRETGVLRSYARYLRQTGIVYSQNHIADTLVRYPAVAADLFALFHDGFDPSLDEDNRTTRLVTRHERIDAALANVPNIDDDRTLRRYVNAIDATLRTNYFQRNADGSERAAFAVKFDPKQLDGLPEPRPFREVFIYGPEVEGVHLRFGKVARGGLRWSDRAQDYRTEVLGLVKAQQVKNAVIVPVGAKGGFLPRKLPAGGSREQIFEAGRDAYKTYIRTLLSITDNIVNGDIVPPADTVRIDGDDPYFVVAADKGTATFSDTANGLAQEAGFWLDDAFASGGSAGYDHKKMGITARGAWETVKRHFREMDIDIQTTPFTVAGVGDMSGDVFGNGMLLSKAIRLVAAFDHRDIVIDPDPDAATSWAERKRLFDLPRSSWQDYDRGLLSKGGMIISRNEKSVTLTPESAAAIGIEKLVATPADIMSAILKAPVDLLWFGGIGTYIKAAPESDAEVGDRGNDAIRVTGDTVRAKVIGEGANLGVTQKGRIAYALAGGRCNSDAIDNSAGVNSSDVEVNIKVALAPAMHEGRLPRDSRNALLVSMTDEVAHLVLRNNYLQSLAISLTSRKGAANREELGRLMNVLEAAGKLDRRVETLPDEAAFAERYASGRPLSRPEIGVLLSYAKLSLFDALIASPLPDEPYLHDTLMHYFPAAMQQQFPADISAHRLHREIIATVLANEVINRGGPGFVQKLVDAGGGSPEAVVRAAIIAASGFGLDRFWNAIDDLDTLIPGEVQNGLYARVASVYEDATRLLLQTGLPDGDIAAAISRLADAVGTLETLEEASGREVAGIDGVPAALLADLDVLSGIVVAPELLLVAGRTGASLEQAARAYASVSATFRIARLAGAGQRIAASDHYESLALSRALERIASARREIVIAALSAHGGEEDAVHAWYASDRVRVNRIVNEITSLADGAELNLARIVVASGLLGDLVSGRG